MTTLLAKFFHVFAPFKSRRITLQNKLDPDSTRKLLLTVNVITYNHAPYVAKCLESLLAQKTNFDFVIRIFDDCSTDGSTEICRDYATKYPEKIQFFPAKKNLGIILNPLRSYEGITTPYYLFIESDDYRLDDYGFQKQIDILEKYPECSFCCSNTINQKNGKFGDVHPGLPEGIFSKEYVLHNPDMLFHSHLFTRIVRTKCIKIDPEYPGAYLNDTTQFYELLVQGPFYFIPQVFGCYVQTGTGVFTGKKLFSRVYYSFEIISQYNDYCHNTFELNLLSFFLLDVGCNYREQRDRIILGCFRETPAKKNNSKYKKLLRYIRHFFYLFVPAGLPVMAHKIRDSIRYIRRKVKN